MHNNKIRDGGVRHYLFVTFLQDFFLSLAIEAISSLNDFYWQRSRVPPAPLSNLQVRVGDIAPSLLICFGGGVFPHPSYSYLAGASPLVL